jgi:hypothetical protein
MLDAAQLPKGQSLERTSDGRPINLPGIYEHKQAGKQIITAPGEEGVVQADALMSPVWQGGWQRIGDVPSRVDLLKARKEQLLKDEKAEAKEKVADKALEAAVI